MTPLCDKLDAFFDGELPADEADSYRDHLATCALCPSVLRGRMEEALVVSAPIDELAVRRRARRMAATGAGLAAAGVALWLLTRGGHPPHDTTVPVVAVVAIADQLAAERWSAPRFSDAGLDRHRPQLVMRGAPNSYERISQTALGELERAGKRNALIAARALNGDVRAAAADAQSLPADAPSLSDRAALALLEIDTQAPAMPWASQQQAAERAISYASAALRAEPGYPQALWNQALAAEQLELPLHAAKLFDEIAAKSEPGWAGEAKARAAQLRTAYDQKVKETTRFGKLAAAMVAGGAPLPAALADDSPSFARVALYQAIATAATPARLDELLPLAKTLDDGAANRPMATAIQRLKANPLAPRAQLASALRELLASVPPETLPDAATTAKLDELRKTAARRGQLDIARAALLAISEWNTEDSDLAIVDKATQVDPWWRAFVVNRKTYYQLFKRRAPHHALQVARGAEPVCRTAPSTWCTRITMYAAHALADLGQLDTSLEQLHIARQMVRKSATYDNERNVLHVIGDVVGQRAQQTIDSVALSAAYFSEYSLRRFLCAARLPHLDLVALSALNRHRYREAVELRDEVDALEADKCKNAQPRLNGETARLRLAMAGHGGVATLEQRIAVLETATTNKNPSFLRMLRAGALLATDRTTGEPALRQVIAEVDADPNIPLADEIRTTSYNALIESAANAGDADRVLDTLAKMLHVAPPARCTVGVAQWNRAAIAVRGADGKSTLAVRDLPEDMIAFPAAELIPPASKAALAGCRRVEVLAHGLYFGMAGLLGNDVAWSYRRSRTGGVPHTPSKHELVISDVRPPDELNLPPLTSFRGAASAEQLRGADATPDAALAKMRTADLVVIVAHGLTDTLEPSAASLILSPDREGEYLLTASKVSTAHLTSSPVVVLAGCEAGRVQVATQPWSLATSFISAGARAVIAPTERIPDGAAADVFDSLIARIRAGGSPAEALQEERTARGANTAWLTSLVVFE